MNSTPSARKRAAGARQRRTQGGAGRAAQAVRTPGSFAAIAILRTRYLQGPSVWTYRAVLEAVIDIGELEDYPSNRMPGMGERLLAWLPGLIEHRCSVGRRGGFLKRLRDGTWAGHILEHLALELQAQAGMKFGFGRTRSAGKPGIYKVVFRTEDATVGRAALEAARDLLMAAINDRPFDVAAAIGSIEAQADRYYLGPSTACIVDAAHARRIPAIRLNDGNLVQLGYGAAQHRIWTAETDRTSAIAEGISRDKALTKQLLAAAGVPVPEGSIVGNAAEAWEAAQEIGLPVTVKPLDANHARGVSLNLRTEEQVASAFQAAEKEGSEVIVERFIAGTEHRLLVVGRRMIAAARGEIVQVDGDGRSTIWELIATRVNNDPRRGLAEEFPLEPLRRDDPGLLLLLQGQGLELDTVLQRRQPAIVQRTGNMCADVTDEVHPTTAEVAALAARVVGLDIAGVDLVAGDIGAPLAQQGGAIVEVNAGPSLLMHLKPSTGRPRNVGVAIVQHLFGDDRNGRIPVVGLLGDNPDSLAARLITAFLQLHGKRTGLACEHGLFLGSRELAAQGRTAFEQARSILVSNGVEAAVIETTVRQILQHGLPYDRCQVGVVLSIPAADPAADIYATENEQMPSIVRTQVDVVLPDGTAVLNADDAAVAALAEYCDGEVLLFGLDPSNPVLARRCADGGRAVLARGTQVVLFEGAQETPLLELSPAVLSTLVGDNRPDALPSVLAAVAAAWVLGVPPELLRAGLLHFDGPRHIAAAA